MENFIHFRVVWLQKTDRAQPLIYKKRVQSSELSVHRPMYAQGGSHGPLFSSRFLAQIGGFRHRRPRSPWRDLGTVALDGSDQLLYSPCRAFWGVDMDELPTNGWGLARHRRNRDFGSIPIGGDRLKKRGLSPNYENPEVFSTPFFQCLQGKCLVHGTFILCKLSVADSFINNRLGFN